MKVLLTILTLLWTMTSCQSSSGNSQAEEINNPAIPEVQQYEMKADTIEIRGKFDNSCPLPRQIKIRKYNVMYSRTEKVPVVNAGFSYKTVLDEPRQITVSTKKSKLDFIATTKEKVYNITISCAGNKEDIDLTGSGEHVAFEQLNKANNNLRKGLEDEAGKDLTQNYEGVKKVLKEYRKEMMELVKDHKGTFTADVIAASEVLPESTIASPDALRKNYFNREVLTYPNYYNTYISSRIVTNYMDFFYDEKHPAFQPFEEALSLAGKNPEAAKRLQQVFHDLFYYKRSESLVMGYINWIETHPQEMKNASVQAHMKGLKKAMPGSKFIEVSLKDPDGEVQRLSDLVDKGNLTVLIYYSPTCSHCQQEVPHLIPLWNEYKKEGLKIYAVAFDATDEEWNWFIENKASEEWIHVFEPPISGVPSSDYGISYTPTFVLIGEDGKIISRLATTEYLEEKIPELLK